MTRQAVSLAAHLEHVEEAQEQLTNLRHDLRERVKQGREASPILRELTSARDNYVRILTEEIIEE